MALKASACQNGKMNLQEFQNLVFSTDERLNVDLDKIVAPSSEEKMKAFDRIQMYKQPLRLDLNTLDAAQKE